MFRISENKIDIENARSEVQRIDAGGFVSFEGWVRNHNEGKEVNSLEYEVYESMAVKEGSKIIEEALSKFEIYDAICIHREGHLQLGDIAVYVGVSSAHRGPAFEACQYIINKVKVRVPIWKKEHYTDGDSGWVACERCGHHSHD